MNAIKILTGLIILCLSISCETDSLKGDWVGFVQLVDSTGMALQDNSGVTARIEDTDHKDVTNKNGRFTFEKVNVGTYKITLTKKGYDTLKFEDVGFVGDKDIDNILFHNVEMHKIAE